MQYRKEKPPVEPTSGHTAGPSNQVIMLGVGILGFLFLVICLFGFFVWPTPYEVNTKGEEIWRVNRWSGVRELSTTNGWKTEREIEDEIEAKRKAEETSKKMQEQADQLAISKLGDMKSLGDVKFGGKSEYTASMSVKWVDGYVNYKLTLKPYTDPLISYSNPYGHKPVTPKLLDKDGFKLLEIVIGDPIKISDAGTFTGQSYEGSAAMTRADYERVAPKVGRLSSTTRDITEES